MNLSTKEQKLAFLQFGKENAIFIDNDNTKINTLDFISKFETSTIILAFYFHKLMLFFIWQI